MESVFQNLCHPATLQLLKYRSKAKLDSIADSFKSPRRKVLAIVAVVLGFIWLSQAIASVMLRESASRADLLQWIPLGLLAYSIWHVIKISSRSPVEPFEWTPAEDEYVRAAPISRPQLISYRLTSILSASLLKALCFSVVMIPDLTIWSAGLAGMFLGLIFVDFIRVCFELFFHGLSKRGQLGCRVVVLSTVVGTISWVLVNCLQSKYAEAEIASPGALLFFKRLVVEFYELALTPIGFLLMMPFQVFSHLILTEQLGANTFGLLLGAILTVFVFGFAIYHLDAWMLRRGKSKELANYQAGLDLSLKTKAEKQASVSRVRVPFRLNGFGSIAWRQLLGAYHYRMTLLISLGLPTLLCCIPLLAKHNPFLMLINVVGGIVFYSFLLLPPALMLDFRRDIDRMSVLKSLPISPLAMTLGQLAAPVLICTLFQWLVLAIASIAGSVVAWQAAVAGFLLVPLNVLIFGLENFIFMLAPFRRNEEGVSVFLRTILTFTGKGVLFGVAAAVTLGWALLANGIAATMEFPAAGPILFGAGVWLITFAAAAACVTGLMMLYRMYDPSQD